MNRSDPDGFTCLYRAAVYGFEVMVRMLLDKSAKVNAQQEDGWTALSDAVGHGRTAAVDLLISNGADANCPSKNSWTPLHIAAEQTDDNVGDKMMVIVLKNGAEVDAENGSFRTSLFSAVWARTNLPCVKRLIDYGANVLKMGNQGNTVLDEAIELGDKDIIECLLNHHALNGPTEHTRGTMHPQSIFTGRLWPLG